MIQEVFVETAWESAEEVRQRRDDRYMELRSTGLACYREDLYTVDARRVFVVRAVPAEQISPIELPSPPSPLHSSSEDQSSPPTAAHSRLARPHRRVQTYEER